MRGQGELDVWRAVGVGFLGRRRYCGKRPITTSYRFWERYISSPSGIWAKPRPPRVLELVGFFRWAPAPAMQNRTRMKAIILHIATKCMSCRTSKLEILLYGRKDNFAPAVSALRGERPSFHPPPCAVPTPLNSVDSLMFIRSILLTVMMWMQEKQSITEPLDNWLRRIPRTMWAILKTHSLLAWTPTWQSMENWSLIRIKLKSGCVKYRNWHVTRT